MKIKYLIDTEISPELELLPFVDRYGGIVKTMNILADGGEQSGKQQRYPVACDVTAADCNNIGIYQNLVPDDSKLSVIYWEELTPMQNTGTVLQNDFYTKKFKGTARLVVWLNLNKLGIDNCKDAINTLPSIEKIITKQGKISSGLYEGAVIKIEPKGMAKKDPKTIFSKYTYPINSQYYLYPYDYYAIDVSFELWQCLAKGGDFNLLPSVDCLNGGGSQTACEVLLSRLTEEQKNECILPVYDFSSTTVTDNLTSTQETDLIDLLCTAPVETPKSFILGGVNEHILFPFNAAYEFEYNTPFTLSCWIKVDTLKTINIFNKYSTTGIDRGYFLIGLTDGSIRMDLQNDGGNARLSVVTPPSALVVGEWQHIAMTYAGTPAASSINIYVNGVSLSLTTLLDNLGNNTIKNNAIPLRIGSNDNFLNGISGLISDCLIFPNELSFAQVLTEYNRVLSGTPTVTPVAWIKGATGSQFGVDTFTQADTSGTIEGVKTVNVDSNETSLDVPT